MQSQQTIKEVCSFIKNLYAEERVELHIPRFIGNEKKYVNECIDSTFVSSIGKFVDRFENDMATLTGAKYAIACVNGTSALHICLILAGVKNTDEVITQPLSFVATSNAISYTGAKIIYLDVDMDTMGLSAESLGEFLEKNCEIQEKDKEIVCVNKRSAKIVRACVPMHTFGHPCRIDAIAAICKKWNITLIEDAAESVGSRYKGIYTGNFGKLSALSFNGNKIITSGGGGAILTNNELLAKKAKHITTTAKIPHSFEYDHDIVGYNYRMPNINAALLVAQLEKLDMFLKRKRELAVEYERFFAKFDDIHFMKEPKDSQSNYWLNAIRLKDREARDEFLKYTHANGVMTRPIWRLNNELQMYKTCECGDLSNAKKLESSIVNIPSSVRIPR